MSAVGSISTPQGAERDDEKAQRMKCSRFTIVCGAVVLVGPSYLPAQAAPLARINAARAQVGIGNLDSATTLLRPLTDSSASVSLSERVNAWVWLGIVDFSRRDRAAAARDFDTALSLDPATNVNGLANLDPALAQLWRQRLAQAPCGDTVRLWHTDGSPLVLDRRSTRAPVRGEPPVVSPPPMPVLHVGGRALVHAVIDASGRAEPQSIWIVDSSDPELDPIIRDAVGKARFRPGQVGDRPARICVVIPFDFRNPPGMDSNRATPF